MKRGRIIAGLLIAVAAGAGVGAWVTAWALGGSTLISVQMSPDRRERVELYAASRWQGLVSPEADLLGYARLTDAQGRTEGESGAFELSGHSEVIWGPDVVQVSSSAVFDRVTRRWTVLH